MRRDERGGRGGGEERVKERTVTTEELDSRQHQSENFFYPSSLRHSSVYLTKRRICFYILFSKARESVFQFDFLKF